LNRVTGNANRQQQVNMMNTQARNQWANNLMNAGMGLVGTLGGVGLASALAAPTTASLLANQVIDPNQMLSAANRIQ
jgi:hypothetical protein